jgi:hypothetical protein
MELNQGFTHSRQGFGKNRKAAMTFDCDASQANLDFNRTDAGGADMVRQNFGRNYLHVVVSKEVSPEKGRAKRKRDDE